MGLMLLYLFTALGVSFTCSVLEAVLLSTPMSFITMKEQEGGGASARLLKKYKQKKGLLQLASTICGKGL